MIVKLLMGLRNNGHRVDVIKPNGETRTVLGTAHPQEDQRRKDVVRQWGVTADSPRPERMATIDEPLSQRAQTILSYQVDSELRQRLNGGAGLLAGSRQPNQFRVAETAPLHIGDPHQDI